MTAPTGGPLTVRKVAFAYPDDFDPCWTRRPEFAFAANSVSLIMPYAEPYFVKSIRGVLAQLDPTLRTRTEDYLHQELQHHRQHRRFNDLVGERYQTVPRVEGWMRRGYGWLSDTRSSRFNVAFAAASETIAFSIARWTEHRLASDLQGSDPVPTTLFLWHLAEEVEHKTAAFDVFEATDGSRLRYSLAMLVSVTMLLFFVWAGTVAQLVATRRWYSPMAYLRLVGWSISLAMTVLPLLLASAVPGHHPAEFSDPVLLPRVLDGYHPEDDTIDLWGVGARSDRAP